MTEVSALSEKRKEAIREFVSEHREHLLSVAVELVRCPSTHGAENGAQDVVARELDRWGFEIVRVRPDAAVALADPSAGYPALSYDGRDSVVGRSRGCGGGRSLHLSGHIDVVPVDEAEAWAHDPWAGEIGNGRLWGRGAGDMKGGLAAYLIAAAAVSKLCPERRGDLIFSSVIEEEVGGNGMWSVLQAGHNADATLIGESSGLMLGHAGTGVVWARLVARGEAGHAGSSARTGPFDQLSAGFAALRQLEAEVNDPVHDDVFAGASPWPYRLSVGKIRGGVWTASTPAELTAYIRFGFGRDTSPAEFQEKIREAVLTAAPEVTVEFEAFRAHAYCHANAGPLPDVIRSSHREVLGDVPDDLVFTATTDARYLDDDCLCYGPIAGNLHGKDEWVDIESLERTAAVVALAAARWLA